MKIFLLADYYQAYLNAFYASHKTEGLSYDQHQKLLFDDYFGSFVSYYNHFKKRGHDVKLVIGNDAFLQKNGLPSIKLAGRGCQSMTSSYGRWRSSLLMSFSWGVCLIITAASSKESLKRQKTSLLGSPARTVNDSIFPVYAVLFLQTIYSWKDSEQWA